MLSLGRKAVAVLGLQVKMSVPSLVHPQFYANNNNVVSEGENGFLSIKDRVVSDGDAVRLSSRLVPRQRRSKYR